MAKITKDPKTPIAADEITPETETIIEAEANAEAETIAEAPADNDSATVETTPEGPTPSAPLTPLDRTDNPASVPTPDWRATHWHLSNHTASVVALPELGSQRAAMLPPYTANVPVQFANPTMFDMLNTNLLQLRQLCAWDEVRGVRLHSTPVALSAALSETLSAEGQP